MLTMFLDTEYVLNLQIQSYFTHGICKISPFPSFAFVPLTQLSVLETPIVPGLDLPFSLHLFLFSLSF